MKLLIVTPALGGVYGGPSKCVVELAQALGKLKIDVDLVTTNANGSTLLEVPLKIWLSKTTYQTQYFPYKGIGDYKFSLSLNSWLYKHVKDYDLVQINAIFSLSNLSAYWACRKYDVPYVVIPHGMLDPWALSYKALKKRIYYNLLEKPALQNAKLIQTLAVNEAEQIKSLNLTVPTAITPNGIHRRDFEKLPNPEVFYQKFPEIRNKTLILFLGRIDPKKGLDLLAKAFSDTLSQFPHTHLIVAGPDNIGFSHTARNFFARVGCLEFVTFTGMLTGPLKYAALAAANIYVAPSYSEGFSMSVLEGMASGLPCVITTGCNFPEAAKTNAAYVVDIDADAIARGIIKCLKSPIDAKKMGERARELIFEKYTWDSIAEKLMGVYKNIILDKPNFSLN
ncbi:glycosyltransferase [Mastigocoleus testarum]|uniref:Glycosyltransferase n=1 Tax=Mastigocoleus testarum BC008 TaxID=371196 RepID=A0A0V7ZFK2_9CYAN|nr:glycosyltransferase [Mastigocoleus testarum]KST63326.1 glycosyltransferase [Mastigocoleus testarum BC008]